MLRLRFQSLLAGSDKYRPEIDGLRALAVLPVLLYHAQLAFFPGGYVGVDIFFVISGYLITSLIAHDLSLNRFSWAGFYERRMRRIFPALFTVAAFCVLAAAVLFAPGEYVTFGESLIAMTFFVSNLFFKRQAGLDGYFGTASETQALLHTWSLSVEEQFYLFFPAALVVLTRWAKGRQLPCLLLAVLASFLSSVWAVRHWPPGAFYHLVPRAWELLVGSLLAMRVLPPLRQRVVRECAGWLGLALIAGAVLTFSKDTDFPGMNAAAPCLGAFLVLYSGQPGPSTVKALLSCRPLVFVGVISYSLYLWHWPILVFSRHFNAGPLDGRATAWAVGLSFVMAFVSFEFIEAPLRGAASRVTRKQVFAFGAAASALALAAGLLIVGGHGFPERYPTAIRDKVLGNEARKTDYQEVCGNWRNDFHAMADITFCPIGDTTSHSIIFWGDSHIQQLYPLINKMYGAGTLPYRGALFVVATGCPPTKQMNRTNKGYHCDAFASLAMKRAEEASVDTVFIAFSTWWATTMKWDNLCPSVEGRCVARISGEEQLTRVLAELAEHIQTLRRRGKRVVVSLPFPIFDKSIPELEVRNAVFGGLGLGAVAAEQTVPSVRQRILSVAKAMGADIFDPRQSLCASQTCVTQLDGISIYKDSNHLAASQIGILEDNMQHVLR